jgi:hypothetical protein
MQIARRTGCERTTCLPVGRKIGLVSDHRHRVGVEWNLDLDYLENITVVVRNLDTSIVTVGDENTAFRVCRYGMRVVEMAGPLTS